MDALKCFEAGQAVPEVCGKLGFRLATFTNSASSTAAWTLHDSMDKNSS
jgi:hypothetical protein